MNEWNLASEILPTDGERVLIYCEYPVYTNVKSYRRGFVVGSYNNFTQKWECDNLIGRAVIAWMRFPEPPKGV